SNVGEQNLVITEEDYINFLTNSMSNDPSKRLLHYVRGKVALSTVLFVGYSLSDWNFRVILKATAEYKRNRSIAVQLNEAGNGLERQRQNAVVRFWEKKNIDIVNVDAAQFVSDLFAQVTGPQEV